MVKENLKTMFVKGNIPAGAEYKAALQDVLHTFPYFQLAQVLFAKQIYDANEPDASGRIKLASVYAPDRKAMYLLFKKPVETSEEIKTLKPTTEPLKKQEKVRYNFVYSSTKDTNIEVTYPPAKKEAEKSSLSEAFIKRESEIKAPPVKARQEEMGKVQPVSPKTEEKKSALPSFQPKITAVPPLKSTSGTIIPPPAKVEKPLTGDKKIEATILQPPVVKELGITYQPIPDSNLKYSFNEWLKVLPEISVEKINEGVKPVNQRDKASIINDFLKQAPTISRPKAEFFSATKAAKMSITEDDELMSETLAEIFVVQGNLQKALKAYQILLLQFPEKKNIFAPRIEELKALMREHTKPGTK